MRKEFPNLQVMIPFVKTQWELEAYLEAIDASRLGHQRCCGRSRHTVTACREVGITSSLCELAVTTARRVLATAERRLLFDVAGPERVRIRPRSRVCHTGAVQPLGVHDVSCGDRVVITAGGIIHDMRCDSTEANGVNDVAEFDQATPITVVATFEDGVHVLRTVGVPIEVKRWLARCAGPVGITVLDGFECWPYQHGLRHMAEIKLARGLVGLGGTTS